MSRATQGGTKIPSLPTPSKGTGGVDEPRHAHLFRSARPVWADNPTQTLPCQRLDVDADWWFDARLSRAGIAARAIAQALCMSCPMQQACLAHARASADLEGMWGGEWFGKLNRPGRRAREEATL